MRVNPLIQFARFEVRDMAFYDMQAIYCVSVVKCLFTLVSLASLCIVINK